MGHCRHCDKTFAQNDRVSLGVHEMRCRRPLSSVVPTVDPARAMGGGHVAGERELAPDEATQKEYIVGESVLYQGADGK